MFRIALMCGLLLGASYSLYHFWFSPVAHYKAQAQQMLNAFGRAVEAQNQSKVKDFLTDIITDNAQIGLEVSLPLPGQQQRRIAPELFGKDDFIALVSNTLYPTKSYHFAAQVTDEIISPDKTTAALDFTAIGTAQGTSHALMEENAQLTMNMECHATIVLSIKPVVSELTCYARIGRQ